MTRAALLLVRVGLPAAIAAAGVVLILTGAGENEQGAGVALIGCAVMVVLLNLFLRLGWRDQREPDAGHARSAASRASQAPASRPAADPDAISVKPSSR